MNIVNFFGVGRRKESSATVFIKPKSGRGKKINGKSIDEYFYTNKFAIEEVLKPLEIIGKLDDYDLFANVKGGGFSSQLEAVRLGLANAILMLDFSYKPILKGFSLLKRTWDRKVERKHTGKKKARLPEQWSKR